MTAPFEMGRSVLTPEELGERWHRHPDVIRRDIRAGRLRAFRIGRAWRIPINVVLEIEAEAETRRNTYASAAADEPMAAL